jgi:hypothetical protein
MESDTSDGSGRARSEERIRREPHGGGAAERGGQKTKKQKKLYFLIRASSDIDTAS